MNRRLLALAPFVALVFANVALEAHAGCHSGHRAHYYPRTYGRPVVQHVVRPVTVVRPTIEVVRPTVEIVQPPVIAPPEPVLPTVPSGATLTIPANFLGDVSGNVFMVFQDIKLPVQINSWSMTGVTITLPPMAIKDAVVVRLDVVLPDGRLGHSQKLSVTAPAPVILHPVAPTSPLPTSAALAGPQNFSGGLLGN